MFLTPKILGGGALTFLDLIFKTQLTAHGEKFRARGLIGRRSSEILLRTNT